MSEIATHEAGLVGARVRTALGDFVVRAGLRGVRAVTPVAGSRAPGAEGAEPAGGAAPAIAPGPAAGAAHRHLEAAAEALRRYAAGDPAPFPGALELEGSELQTAVWERLRAIPFGATATYGSLARSLGLPGEARTVGAAVAVNPLCILVPCHRVLGADGSLRGFAWGLALKRRLLAHEGSAALPLLG